MHRVLTVFIKQGIRIQFEICKTKSIATNNVGLKSMYEL